MSDNELGNGGGGVPMSTADFETLYQGGGIGFGQAGPRMEVIPWRLDGPQPLISELQAAGEITSPVLECGCGLGDNAVFLAGQGYQVTAFDAAATAIEHARATARDAGVSVGFLVADATTLEGIPGGFATVVDSAMLHCLSDQQRGSYLTGLRRVCQPGARLHVLCFQAEFAAPMPLAASLDETSLRQAFTQAGWHIERMQPRRYTTGMTRLAFTEQVPAALRDQFLPDLDQGATDEHGRLLLPVWQITAVLN